MCGIVGYLDRSGAPAPPVGERLVRMLEALACRGPDSAGAALWGPEARGVIVRVKVPLQQAGASAIASGGRSGRGESLSLASIDRAARRLGRIRSRAIQDSLARLEIATGRPTELARAIESIGADVEVVSMGRRLEIVKQVGSPRNLDTQFGLSRMTGTHGIGHTRLSTESRVDLSHSQPFWAHGTPDLAVVHNGHITNYHRLRRVYEQDGARFYTENDSEIVAIYLARALAAGAAFREALEASVRELDGSFSYLAATAAELGFAKDPFCLKPLIVGESDTAIAIANEEVALQAAFAGPYMAREAGSAAVSVWTVPAPGDSPTTRGRRPGDSPAARRRRAA
jgi:glutamate synthase domain-containing protein 1